MKHKLSDHNEALFTLERSSCRISDVYLHTYKHIVMMYDRNCFHTRICQYGNISKYYESVL